MEPVRGSSMYRQMYVGCDGGTLVHTVRIAHKINMNVHTIEKSLRYTFKYAMMQRATRQTRANNITPT